MRNEHMCLMLMYTILHQTKNKTKSADKLAKQISISINKFRYKRVRTQLTRTKFKIESIKTDYYTEISTETDRIWNSIIAKGETRTVLLETMLVALDTLMGQTNKFYGRGVFDKAIISYSHANKHDKFSEYELETEGNKMIDEFAEALSIKQKTLKERLYENMQIK